MMSLDRKFWILLVVFQVFFGLAVFAVTRDYYMQDTENVRGHPWTTGQSAPAWPQGFTESEIARLSSPPVSLPMPTDPAEISRQADEYFRNKQYVQAAQLYEQLLTFDSNNAEIYNNLGLTLHYVGRSDEALRRLNEGIAVDAEHQRTWLTLGFVNAQLGNFDEARAALTKATQLGSNESVREAAAKMLAELP